MEKLKIIWNKLSMYVQPTNNSSTLGMYQRTIVISSWCSLILFIGAFVLEYINNHNQWIILIENCFIGISCSLIVVIITTIIQFCAEQNRKTREYLEVLFQLLNTLDNISLGLYDNLENTDWIYSETKDLFNEYMDIAFDLLWFNNKRTVQHYQIALKLLKIQTPLINRRNSFIDFVSQISQKDVAVLIDLAYDFSKKYYGNKPYNVFLHLKESKELNTNKD